MMKTEPSQVVVVLVVVPERSTLSFLCSATVSSREGTERGRPTSSCLFLAQCLITLQDNHLTLRLKYTNVSRSTEVFFPLYQFVADYFVLAYKHGSFRILCRQ